MNEINIAGAGLAGLSAAIWLAKAGIGSNLISIQNSERAQSVLAEGGINSALDTMKEDDSPKQHLDDTLKGGVWLADPEAVKGLTYSSPEIVEWLIRIGVPFHMKDGKVILRNFGGQKKKRTVYAKSSTGKVVVNALSDEARKYEALGLIKRYDHHKITDIDIETDNNNLSVKGLFAIDVYTNKKIYFGGPVVLACGGLNGLFPERTTGTVNNTGLLAAKAFEKGVEFANLEFIQYHPTTVGIPGKRMLISEAARGEGGRLYIIKNGRPWYFMEEKYPELKNLMPRDVVSREMFNVINSPECEDEVFLDMTGIKDEIWDEKLSDMRDEIKEHLKIDMKDVPVKVEPGIHFFMGGIKVDRSHRTNVQGLYAAGECACQYHGANRLGGNSMLAAIYGGKVVAENISSSIKDLCDLTNNGIKDDISNAADDNMVRESFSKDVSDILLSALGIIRNDFDIQKALDLLENYFQNSSNDDEKAIYDLSKAMLICAKNRKESRGAHTNKDHPDTKDDYKKTSVIYMKENEMIFKFEDIRNCGGAKWKL